MNTDCHNCHNCQNCQNCQNWKAKAHGRGIEEDLGEKKKSRANNGAATKNLTTDEADEQINADYCSSLGRGGHIADE